MIDLEKLQQKIDNTLDNETEESLTNWLMCYRSERHG